VEPERRVVGKAEILGDKDNPRFIVTNLPAQSHAAAPLYEQVYCGRGERENAIKEHQLDLFGERLSCHGFASNEVRLLLASFAQLLLERLRTIGLAGTTLARATAGTIRLQLLKLAAQITVSVRRVHIRFASAFARQAEFAASARPARRVDRSRMSGPTATRNAGGKAGAGGAGAFSGNGLSRRSVARETRRKSDGKPSSAEARARFGGNAPKLPTR